MTPAAIDPSADDDKIRHDDTTNDRALGWLLHSLSEDEYLAIEKSLDSGDVLLKAAAHEWAPIVQELSLALSPVAPDPRILSALLSRIGVNDVPQRTDVTVSEITSAEDHTAISSSKNGSQKSLIIRRADGPGWRSAGAAGARMRILNFDRRQGRTTFLLQIDPGSTYPGHLHQADEECLVISGDIHEGDLNFGPGDYFLAPAGSEHGDLTTVEGCVCLITTAIPMNK